MKSIKISTLTTGFIITALFLIAFIGRDKIIPAQNIAKADGKGFAVLELFTSEGCSSCPPADELMAKIQQEAVGKNIYILAYHVDYWNNLGWKDSFSDAAFSERQKQYGSWLNAQVYTPQLVINGKKELVGSDESAVRHALLRQLAANPVATLALQLHQDRDKLMIQYQSTGAIKGSSLLIALVQKAAQSKVARGENAGHTLSHVQIVRKLQNEPLSVTGSGNATLTLPKGFNNQNWEILGLVQNQSNGEILAATKANLIATATTGK